MKTNLKKKELITAGEVIEAEKLYHKIKKLKDQLASVKKDFTVLELEIIRKYDKDADIEDGSPMFLIKEWSRRIVAWEAELEKLCGKEVVEEIKARTEPRQYRNLEF